MKIIFRCTVSPLLVLFHFADSRSREVAKELYDDYYLYAERRIARKNSAKLVAEFFCHLADIRQIGAIKLYQT